MRTNLTAAVGDLGAAQSVSRMMGADLCARYLVQGRSPEEAKALTLAQMRPLESHVNPYTLATTTTDQWKTIDPVVVPTRQGRGDIVGDLMGSGLVYNLANPFGTMIIFWNDSGDFTAANVAMDTQTPPEEDRMNYEERAVPIPVISKGFRMGQRFDAMSPQTSADNAAAAARSVRYMMNEIVFNGWAGKYRGYDIPGLTTHTARNIGTLNADWTTATQQQKVNDVERMVGMAWEDFVAGPFRLYVPYNYLTTTQGDYWAEIGSPAVGVVAPNRTLLDRLRAIDGISGIEPSLHLTDELVLVAMDSDTIEYINGVGPIPVNWEDGGGFTRHTRVIQIGSVRIKQDQKGRCGVVHFSKP